MSLSYRFLARCSAFSLILLALSASSPLYAQSRMSDRDIEALMKNLKEDSKSFREEFDDAIKKSAIRRTSQEKDARSAVESFEKQADAMLNEFRKTRKGDVAVETTLSNAQEVNHILQSLPMGGKISAQWEKIQSELDEVSSGFGINVTHRRR